MRTPIQITLHGIDHSDSLDKHIRDKATKLDEFFGHITSCRVVVELPHKHHQQGNQFSIRLDISVPGKDIAINRDHAEDIYVALRDAFDAARRQIEDYSRKTRGNVKKHEPRRMRAIDKNGEPHSQVIDDR